MHNVPNESWMHWRWVMVHGTMKHHHNAKDPGHRHANSLLFRVMDNGHPSKQICWRQTLGKMLGHQWGQCRSPFLYRSSSNQIFRSSIWYQHTAFFYNRFISNTIYTSWTAATPSLQTWFTVAREVARGQWMIEFQLADFPEKLYFNTNTSKQNFKSWRPSKHFKQNLINVGVHHPKYWSLRRLHIPIGNCTHKGSKKDWHGKPELLQGVLKHDNLR